MGISKAVQTILIMIIVINFGLISCQPAVGVTTPIPTFITSEYAIVDRIVTIFCMVACGGECESCCNYVPPLLDGTSQATPYLQICNGRLGSERGVCQELLSNLEFICQKSTYKYRTDSPAQEFQNQLVFNSKRNVDALSFRPALGFTTTNPIPVSTGKKRTISDIPFIDQNEVQIRSGDYYDDHGDYYDDHGDYHNDHGDYHNDHKNYYDDHGDYYDGYKNHEDLDQPTNIIDPTTDALFRDYSWIPRSLNVSAVPFQEVYVCANENGAVHYRPATINTPNPNSSPIIQTPFWSTWQQQQQQRLDMQDQQQQRMRQQQQQDLQQQQQQQLQQLQQQQQQELQQLQLQQQQRELQQQQRNNRKYRNQGERDHDHDYDRYRDSDRNRDYDGGNFGGWRAYKHY